jgi:2-(1,2-epoxy-1,2-dihydrophenyl)acetyl-CoA isomerase
VVAHAQRVARKLANGPSAVLGQIRALHASTFDHSLEQQLRAERSAQEMSLEAQDCVEGVRAFFEKREPNFSEH